MQIDVLPGNRRNPSQQVTLMGITGAPMMEKQIGEKRGIVGNDAIGEQTTAFLPQILFIRGAKPKLAKVSVSNRPPELMKTFPTIQGTLDMVSQ